MENSEIIITIQWMKSDSVEALEKERIEPSEENIDKAIPIIFVGSDCQHMIGIVRKY